MKPVAGVTVTSPEVESTVTLPLAELDKDCAK